MRSTEAAPGGGAAGLIRGDTRALARFARGLLLAVGDSAALFVAAAGAYASWALPMREQPAGVYLEMTPVILLFVAGYSQAGLYPGFGLGPVETLRRLSYVTAFGFLLLAAFFYVLKAEPFYSRATYTFALVYSLIAVPLVRGLLFSLGRRWRWWGEPVVVIGTAARAARIIGRLRQASRFGYRPAAVLALEPAMDAAVEGVPVAGGLDRAPDLAAAGIRVALLQSQRADPFRERAMVDRLQRDFRHVVLLREYDDLPVEGLQIRNLGNLVGIEYTNNLLLPGNRTIKRAIDILLAALGLMVFAPVVAVAGALVIVLDGRPIFFRQDREGLDGRRIAVPKLRTMRIDAEQRLKDHLAADPHINDEWKRRYKLRNDPRLIPVIGRPFRRFSIDELPQLWSVLAGDMSLVGPRPFPDYHVAQFSQAFRQLRQRVRPGITGLWQVTVRSEGSLEEQEAYDSYYIRNWSIWLDIYILSRTLATVASGRGAY